MNKSWRRRILTVSGQLRARVWTLRNSRQLLATLGKSRRLSATLGDSDSLSFGPGWTHHLHSLIVSAGKFTNVWSLYQRLTVCFLVRNLSYMKISFHSLANRTHFHIKGFTLDVALKQRQMATRKWLFEFAKYYVRYRLLTEFVCVIPGGGGVLNKVLYGEAPPRVSNPYPFIYHFWQKR